MMLLLFWFKCFVLKQDIIWNICNKILKFCFYILFSLYLKIFLQTNKFLDISDFIREFKFRYYNFVANILVFNFILQFTDIIIRYIYLFVCCFQVKVLQLDLSDFDNVRKVAQEFIDNEKHLDYLINNAGKKVVCLYLNQSQN